MGIHLIDTIAYSTSIVGVRTQKYALAWSLGSVVSLSARSIQTLQAPLWAKSIETNLQLGTSAILHSIQLVMLFAVLGTLIGILTIPTMHRFFAYAVEDLSKTQSMPRLLMKFFRLGSWKILIKSITLPSKNNITQFKRFNDIPLKLVGVSVLIQAFSTVSVLSCLYAGAIQPDLRATLMSMSGVSNSISVILHVILLGPGVAIIHDEVRNNTYSESYHRRFFVFMITARLIGTLLSQLLILPIATILIYIAKNLYA
jgi:hypothetical protein